MNQVPVEASSDLRFYKIYDERKAVLDHCSQSMQGAMADLNREIMLCRQSLQHTRQVWDDLDRISQSAVEIDPSSIMIAGIIDFAGAVGL